MTTHVYYNAVYRLLSISLFLLACQRSPTVDRRRWKRLDYGVFTLQAPPEWKKFEEQGIDSYVAGLTDGKDSLEFDYGWYSPELSPRDVDSTHLFASDSIDGYEAVIAIPRRDSIAPVELSMDLPNRIRLSFGGLVHDPRIAVAIFQSLRFKHGDTTRNTRITVDQFTASFPKTGHSMFQMVCNDCHSRTRFQGAPALTPELLGKLGNDSIYRFLTHRYPLADSNSFHCPNFTNWSRGDIDQIVAYIRNSPQ
jgi:hypothetical protein